VASRKWRFKSFSLLPNAPKINQAVKATTKYTKPTYSSPLQLQKKERKKKQFYRQRLNAQNAYRLGFQYEINRRMAFFFRLLPDFIFSFGHNLRDHGASIARNYRRSCACAVCPMLQLQRLCCSCRCRCCCDCRLVSNCCARLWNLLRFDRFSSALT